MRCPDVTFVSAARLPAGRPQGFAELAPARAVEVLSPNDRQRDVLDRVGEYLGAGVRLVWAIDPEQGTAVVFRSLTDIRRVERDGVLDGEDVVPGFACCTERAPGLAASVAQACEVFEVVGFRSTGWWYIESLHARPWELLRRVPLSGHLLDRLDSPGLARCNPSAPICAAWRPRRRPSSPRPSQRRPTGLPDELTKLFRQLREAVAEAGPV